MVLENRVFSKFEEVVFWFGFSERFLELESCVLGERYLNLWFW